MHLAYAPGMHTCSLNAVLDDPYLFVIGESEVFLRGVIVAELCIIPVDVLTDVWRFIL